MPSRKNKNILATPLQSNYSGKEVEVGCDEAGRGCLAGPVFAAAVIFPKGYTNPNIQDSKALKEVDREALADLIKQEALYYNISRCSPNEIDKWNILRCSIKAMHRAIKGLGVDPEFIIVDGNYFLPYKQVSYQTIVKGDAKFLSIAAASILAKVARDNYMKTIDKKHPEYLWIQNKGYPTRAHREAIASSGITKYHRKSFQLLKDVSNDQLLLNL